jgi:thiol-disulfide isomerase/thioredoxin
MAARLGVAHDRPARAAFGNVAWTNRVLRTMRSSRIRNLAVYATVALALAACGGDGSDGAVPTSGASGEAAATNPAFTAATLGGEDLDSGSFEGKDTVLWFWAPWCTVCRGEAPNVNAAAAALDGEVQVVGVAGRGQVSEMEDFVSDTDTGGLTHVIDESGEIWSSYEVVSQPTFAFIDDDGTYDIVVGAMGEDALVERMTALAAT